MNLENSQTKPENKYYYKKNNFTSSQLTRLYQTTHSSC